MCHLFGLYFPNIWWIHPHTPIWHMHSHLANAPLIYEWTHIWWMHLPFGKCTPHPIPECTPPFSKYTPIWWMHPPPQSFALVQFNSFSKCTNLGSFTTPPVVTSKQKLKLDVAHSIPPSNHYCKHPPMPTKQWTLFFKIYSFQPNQHETINAGQDLPMRNCKMFSLPETRFMADPPLVS